MNLKVEIARHQLGTALAMFLEDVNPVAVHCLAAGGCEVLEYYAEKAGGKPFISHMLSANPSFDKKKLHRLQREYWNAFKDALKADKLTER
jgi:hypothetical protein